MAYVKHVSVSSAYTEKHFMTANIRMLTLGAVQTNCYLVGDPTSGDCVLIDAPDSAATILDAIRREGWTLRAVLITHAHFDHILAAGEVAAATGAPIHLHASDLALWRALPMQMARFGLGEVPPPPEPDVFVEGESWLSFGALHFEVRFTPGHAPGHVSYVLHEDTVAFSGDCLFAGSIGRTDLPGGDQRVLLQSIASRLLSLEDDYTIACGHGQTTTVAMERNTNPFVRDWYERRN
jgi:glyoxylase-like metal-dependent hydrolase (beta-lactamase superfamily II)